MIPISGEVFQRALLYAMKACPNDAGNTRLQHLALIDRRIIGSDGTLWLVGILPEGAGGQEPVIVTQTSAFNLTLGLAYARRMAKRLSAQFEVIRNGLEISIRYGREPLVHMLDQVQVGRLPAVWTPPVPDDAPLLTDASQLPCGSINKASVWYQSWEKNYGTISFFGAGGNSPVRIDIVSEGDVVAQAYVLPENHPPAALVPDEPLLDRIEGDEPKRGQSILDLVVDPKAAKPSAAPKKKGGRKKKGEEKPAEESGGNGAETPTA